MTLLEFIRLIIRYWKVLILFPLLTACTVYYLTNNTKKEYTSNCEVYTGIASGYGITSGENDRIDYFAVNNAFDNLMATIKSRETIEEVGMRLLAKHLLVEQPSYAILSKEHYDHLREIIPADLRKKLTSKKSEELTYFRIESYRSATTKNEIIDILKKGTEIYSFDYISGNMSALRKQSSDMINISYKCDDPAACQQTLQLIVDVVIERYKGIKGSETNNVLKYFEEQLKQAAGRLRKSEDHLRDYSSENKIINYYEEAKYVAEAKQNVIADQQQQQMDLDASKAALSQIEKKMNLKKGLLEVNDKILKLREQLADANFKIANAEMYNENKEQLENFKTGAEQIKRQIREEVDKNYKLNNTTEGLPRVNLLQEWLGNYLAIEENQAKLNVINERLSGFDALYNELAPIGSNLKRIEREVEVNEKEYMSILHGLNMARLRQQSLQMSNNLTITDSPFLPLEPLPSKRGMLIIVAFIAVFMFTLSAIVAKSLLGKTVQTPARAEKFTGLQFIGAVPNYDNLDKSISLEKMEETLLNHLVSSIKLKLKNCETIPNQPTVILVGSTQNGIGKTFLIDKVSKVFSSSVGKVVSVMPDAEDDFSNPLNIKVGYNSGNHALPIPELSYWLETKNIDFVNLKYIIIELTALNKYNIPESFLANSCINIVVMNAEKLWSESDSRALGYFSKSTKSKSFVILNKIETERLESIIGEIPKKRSIARRIVKRIITLNFKRT